MHMADALLSPTVGLTFMVASGAGIAYSAKKLRDEGDERKVPLMGVLGAFVFAAQMINFSIPGTGSSGHLGGGMLLTMILGPYAAFITIASVLIIQALFFADGGILALGTNIWNLGFYPCAVGWLIYKVIAGKNPTYSRLSIASIVGVVVALEMGAFSVVIETLLSGKSELTLGKFSALMLGIHFPIALIEGVVTLAVVNFIYKVRPEIIKANLGLGEAFEFENRSLKPIVGLMVGAAIVVGGVVAWFASAYPDGLEWSISKVYGSEELPEPNSGFIHKLGKLQEKTAILPDYSFKSGEEEVANEEEKESWPAVSGGTSVSGIIGSFMVLTLSALIGFAMVKLRGKVKQ